MASGSGTATRGGSKSSSKTSSSKGPAASPSFYDKARRQGVTRQMQRNANR